MCLLWTVAASMCDEIIACSVMTCTPACFGLSCCLPCAPADMDAWPLRVVLQHVPPGRFALVDEIANAALFLASDESSYVNATAFLVDGGISAAYTTPLS